MSRQQVPNYELASDASRANLLTNGGFEIWQRGNGPFSASNVFNADRWQLAFGGSSTGSVSRDTANTDGSLACAAVTYTHNATSSLYQKVEDFAQLRGKSVTFSVRVRTSTANAVKLSMNDGVSNPASATFHTGDNSYQTLTQTMTVAANATQLLPAVSLNASCTSYVDNAMLVVGSVPADYAPLHPADDLARCLRYYEAHGGTSTAMVHGGYSGVANMFLQFTHRFSSQKAVTPTLTKVGTWNTTNANQPTVGDPGVSGYTLGFQAPATGFAQVYAPAGSSVTAEANP